MNTSKRIIGTIFAVLSAVAFGFIPLVANMAYREGIQVNTLLFLRFGVGALILWGYIFIKKIPFKVTLSHFFHIVMIGLLGYTLTTTAYFYAFQYIPSSLTTIITFLFPIIVVAYEMIKERKLEMNKIICLILTMLGLSMIVGVWDGGTGGDLNPIGIGLALLSAVAYAIFCIGAGEKRTTKMNSIALSAYVMSICTVAYMIISLVLGQPLIPPTLASWSWIGILGVLCGIMPILLLAVAIKMIGSGSAAIAGAFEPLASCILGVAFLGESLTLNMIIGGTLIVVSVLGVEMFKGSRKEGQKIEGKIQRDL